MKRALLTLALGLATATAGAGEVEIAVQLGRSLPFYKQSFALNPEQVVPPDVPVSTSGGFDLELGGGLTFGGAVTWRFTDSLGLVRSVTYGPDGRPTARTNGEGESTTLTYSGPTLESWTSRVVYNFGRYRRSA